MGIYPQICGLIIVLVLFFFYKKQPIMGLNSEHRFQQLLYTVVISIVFDILSRIVPFLHLQATTLLSNITSKLYLVSLCATTYLTLRYTIADIESKKKRNTLKFQKYLFSTVYLILCAIILVLPIKHVFEKDIVYSTGPSTFATFIGCAAVLSTILVEVIINRKVIKPKRRHAIMCWILLWLVAATTEFFMPEHFIIGFVSCIGVLIIYFEIENPEAARSRRTGHFSSAVIREYLDFLYSTKTDFSVMMISFSTVGNSTQDSELIRKTIINLSDFLFSIKDAKIFDTAEGYFILVFKTFNQLEVAKNTIQNYFATTIAIENTSYTINLLSPFYTIVSNSNVATNSDELLSLISEYTPNNLRNYSENEVFVDLKTVMSLKDKKILEDMVVNAIEQDNVVVHYQPIYNMQTKKFSTAEALVRIRLHDGSLIMPGKFIPIVEESGRIIALSNEIYKKAFSFMKSYHLERLGIDYIEMNLSVRQGDTPMFAEKFIEIMNEYHINGNMVNLEITETSSINSKENMQTNMAKLNTVGLTFSLDDFGSGSSNLNYIIDMPVSIVKLDKTLTDAYFISQKANAIVKAVINMAHSIGIKIVAEGIETKEQLDEMEKLGIDYIQGYYFSKPLCERDFLSFLQKNNLH